MPLKDKCFSPDHAIIIRVEYRVANTKEISEPK
jgi:hypothetical protein